MTELVLIFSYWLHLVATVVWVGGIIFILFVAIPSARQVLGAEAGRFMGDISKRSTPLANYSILLLAVTGIVLAGLRKQFTGAGSFENHWFMTLKLVFVFSMVSIHFYRGSILAPRIMRTVSETDKGVLQKLSINLVKLNFMLALLVLLLSGAISVFRGY